MSTSSLGIGSGELPTHP